LRLASCLRGRPGCTWRAGCRWWGLLSRRSRRCWTGGGTNSLPGGWRSRRWRDRAVRAFVAHADAFPREWTPGLVDDWMTDPRTVRRLRRSTQRGYQIAVRLFCGYVTDPAYNWPGECEARFDTYPVQVVHEWNAAVHARVTRPRGRSPGMSSRRSSTGPTTRSVPSAAGCKRLLAAFRDAVLFKVAYGYGLRRNEVWMLGVADFGPNAHAPEFGELGVCCVRLAAERWMLWRLSTTAKTCG
jgi:integrase/recombinase XerC